jgi:hypothetical protein
MTGVEQRAQMDTETFKGLLVVNGGAAVALLASLSTILKYPEYLLLARAVFVGLIVLMFGLAFAIVHNHLRRRCSLLYEQHKMAPPRGILFGKLLPQPTVCFFSLAFMWSSLVAFVAASLTVACVGLATL